jgi:hypothetical protein
MTIRARRSQRIRVRPLPTFQNLRHEIGRAAESGGTVHIALGNGGLAGGDCVTSFAGLEAVAELADTAVLYNAPPVITVGDPTLIPLAQDILREAHERHDLVSRYSPNQVRFVAPSPISYAACAADLVMTEDVTTTLIIGAFGPEVSLIADAGERRGLNQLAAAADPNAIGSLYPAIEDLAIGEELFGAGAQVTNKTRYTISVKVEDLVRLILAIVIIAAPFFV